MQISKQTKIALVVVVALATWLTLSICRYDDLPAGAPPRPLFSADVWREWPFMAIFTAIISFFLFGYYLAARGLVRFAIQLYHKLARRAGRQGLL